MQALAEFRDHEGDSTASLVEKLVHLRSSLSSAYTERYTFPFSVNSKPRFEDKHEFSPRTCRIFTRRHPPSSLDNPSASTPDNIYHRPRTNPTTLTFVPGQTCPYQHPMTPNVVLGQPDLTLAPMQSSKIPIKQATK